MSSSRYKGVTERWWDDGGARAGTQVAWTLRRVMGAGGRVLAQLGKGPAGGLSLKVPRRRRELWGVVLQLRSLYPGQLSGFRRALHSTATSHSAAPPPPCPLSGRQAQELKSQPLARWSHAEAARWAGRGGTSPAAWPRPHKTPPPPHSCSERGGAPPPPRPSLAPPLSAERRGVHLVHRPSLGLPLPGATPA